MEVKHFDLVTDNGGGPLTPADMWLTLAVTPAVVVPNPLPCGNIAYINNLGTMHAIAQGTLSSNRQGREIVIKAIESRVLFNLVSTQEPASTSVSARLLVVLDKQCNKNHPAQADMFKIDPDRMVNSLYNEDNKHRFVFLSDETFEINAQDQCGAGAGLASVSPQKNKIVKLVTNIPIEYNGTAGLITQITSNNLFLCLLLSGNPSAAGPPAVIGARVNAMYSNRVMYVG